MIALGGARELVPLLAKELREGGDAQRGQRGATGRMPPRSSGSASPKSMRSAPPRSRGSRSSGSPRARGCRTCSTPTWSRSAPAVGSRSPRSSAALAGVLGTAGPGLAARLPVLRERRGRRADQRGRAPERACRCRHLGSRHRPADPDAQPAPARLRGSRSPAGGRSTRGSSRSRSAVGERGVRLAPRAPGRSTACPSPAGRRAQRRRLRRDARGRRGGPPPFRLSLVRPTAVLGSFQPEGGILDGPDVEPRTT